MNLDTNLTKGVDFAAARQAVNLNVLRRHDANILDILDSSSHVVVYDFDMSSQSWTKKGIEGTMFLFRRSVEPHYGLMIMNRLGIENLMILLTPHMEVQLLGEYVIYRKPDDSVQGLWMYETVDRTRLASELSRYAQMSQTSAIDGPSAPASQSISEHHGPPAANGPPVDIMALLQRAKSVGQMETPYQSPPSQPNPVQQPSYAGPAPPLPQQPRDSSPYMYLPSARQATPTFPDHRQPVYQPAHPEPGPQSVISGEPLLAALGIRPQKPVSATFSTNQRQIQRLQDVWQWMEDLAPSQRGQLPDTEFRNRLLHLVQEDPMFVDAMYRSYRYDTASYSGQ